MKSTGRRMSVGKSSSKLQQERKLLKWKLGKQGITFLRRQVYFKTLKLSYVFIYIWLPSSSFFYNLNWLQKHETNE